MKINFTTKKIIFSAILLLIVIGIFVLPIMTLAVTSTTDFGIDDAQATGLATNDLRVTIINVIRVLLGFLGIIAVILILYGGFIYMTAAGDPAKLDKAKKILTSAAIGAVIILSAFIIASFAINVLGGALGPGGGGGTPPVPPLCCFPGLVNQFSYIHQFKDDAITTPNGTWFRNVGPSFSGVVGIPISTSTEVGGWAKNGGGTIESMELFTAPSSTVPTFSPQSFFTPLLTTVPVESNVYAVWDTFAYALGDSYLSKILVTPLDSSNFESNNMRSIVRPLHCFNGVEDTANGETGVDCGGDPVALGDDYCGACGNGQCVDDSDCAGGVCVDGACAMSPVINSITPSDGAPGNYVVVGGRYFGDEPGNVSFVDGGGSIVGFATTTLSVDCEDTWYDNHLIFMMPNFSIGDYQVVVENSYGLVSDGMAATSTINTIKRPGICRIDPAGGINLATTTVYGNNFTVDDLIIWNVLPDNTTSTIESFIDSGSVTAIVPASVVGNTSIRIYNTGDAEYSNFFDFVVSSGQEGESCGAPLVFPATTCSAENICLPGLYCDPNDDCTCQTVESPCTPGVTRQCVLDGCWGDETCPLNGNWDDAGPCQTGNVCIPVIGIDSAVQSIYSWAFTYGYTAGNQPPRVIEDCNRVPSCQSGQLLPSPTPWYFDDGQPPLEGWDDTTVGVLEPLACVNAIISARFTEEMNAGSVGSNVSVFRYDGSLWNLVPGVVDIDPLDDSFEFYPNPPGSVLQATSSYKVVLTKGIMSGFEVEMEKNTRVLEDRDCTDSGFGDAVYCWNFHTRELPTLCEPGCPECTDDPTKMYYLGQEEKFNANVDSEDNVCIMLNPRNYSWEWTSEIEKLGLLSDANNSDPEQWGVAKGDGRTNIFSKLLDNNKEDFCRVINDFTNPVVIEKENCDDDTVQSPTPYIIKEDACTNALIGASFSMSMEDSTIENSNDNIIVYECDDATCSVGNKTPIQINEPEVSLFEISPGVYSDRFTTEPTTGLLKILTWYQVVIIGGEDGVRGKGSNLISNSGFQSGDANDATGWSYQEYDGEGVSSRPNIGHNSTHSMKLRNISDGWTYEIPINSLSVNEVYTLSYWAMTSPHIIDPDNEIRADVYCKIPGGSFTIANTFFNSGPTAGDWYRDSEEFVVTKHCSTPFVRLIITDDNLSQSVHFDDIRLEQTSANGILKRTNCDDSGLSPTDDDYCWTFKTGNGECDVASVQVDPRNYTMQYIDDIQGYRADAIASNCNILNPNSYEFVWRSLIELSDDRVEGGGGSSDSGLLIAKFLGPVEGFGNNIIDVQAESDGEVKIKSRLRGTTDGCDWNQSGCGDKWGYGNLMVGFPDLRVINHTPDDRVHFEDTEIEINFNINAQMSSVRVDGGLPTNNVRLYGCTVSKEHFKLDGNATTSSFFGHDGVIEGLVPFPKGKIGQAAKFDGNPDNYIQIDDNPMGPMEHITVSAWVKPTGLAHDDGRVVVGNYWYNDVSPTGDRGWILGDPFNVFDKFVFKVCGGSSNCFEAKYEGFFEEYLNKWVHVAGVYSGDKHYANLYINGELVDSAFAANSKIISHVNIPTMIGHRADRPDQGAWDGLIDDVRIYDSSLSNKNIMDVYNGIACPMFEAFQLPLDGVQPDGSGEPLLAHEIIADLDLPTPNNYKIGYNYRAIVSGGPEGILAWNNNQITSYNFNSTGGAGGEECEPGIYPWAGETWNSVDVCHSTKCLVNSGVDLCSWFDGLHKECDPLSASAYYSFNNNDNYKNNVTGIWPVELTRQTVVFPAVNVSSVDGQEGDAGDFNGANYITYNTRFLNHINKWSISFWVYPRGDGWIYSEGHPQATFRIEVINGVDIKIRTWDDDNGGTWDGYIAANMLNTDEWNFVEIDYDNGSVRVMANDLELAGSLIIQSDDLLPNNNYSALGINVGWFVPLPSAPQDPYYFDGMIDEFRIYSNQYCDDNCHNTGNTNADSCGDGIVGPNEECDDGDVLSGNGCASNCLWEGASDVWKSYCGDWAIDYGELCDDGNVANGDGCDEFCLLESGRPSGSTAGVSACGNGIKEEGEDCDDNNLDNNDGCSNSCSYEGSTAGGATCGAGSNVVETGQDDSYSWVFEAVDDPPFNINTNNCSNGIWQVEDRYGEVERSDIHICKSTTQVAFLNGGLWSRIINKVKSSISRFFNLSVSADIGDECGDGYTKIPQTTSYFDEILEYMADDSHVLSYALSNDVIWEENYRYKINIYRDGFNPGDDPTASQSTIIQEDCELDDVRVDIWPRGKESNDDKFFCVGDDCGSSTDSLYDNDISPSTNDTNASFVPIFEDDYDFPYIWSLTNNGNISSQNRTGNQHLYQAYGISRGRLIKSNSFTWDSSGLNQFNISIADFDGSTYAGVGIKWITLDNANPNAVEGLNLVTVTSTQGVIEKAAKVDIKVFLCNNPWPEADYFPYRDSLDVPTPICDTTECTNFEIYYCRDRGDIGEDDDLPSLSVNPAIAYQETPLKKEFLFTTSTGAVGIRVLENDNHYSPLLWYYEEFDQDRQGSPQSLMVDGYNAIREGRTVYTGASNVINTSDKHTYIYLVSYNEGADVDVINAYNEIVKYMKFNTNHNASIATCSDNSNACLIDSDCSDGAYCKSTKARITRDVDRLGDIYDIQKLLDNYHDVVRCGNDHSIICYTGNECYGGGVCGNHYPDLLAGSYIAGRSFSVWPSWQATLGNVLGSALPVDPRNTASSTDPFDNDGFGFDGCGEGSDPHDKITCWDDVSKTMRCPIVGGGKMVYSYRGTNGAIRGYREYGTDSSWNGNATFLTNFGFPTICVSP